MPWQSDPNTGRCSLSSCKVVGIVSRCDAMFCMDCCTQYHSDWNAHRQPDGTVTRVFPDATRSGYNSAHAAWCNCVACKSDKAKTAAVPVEWDYDGFPVEFTEVKELGEDYERCFVPLSNFKANKDWPADYIG